MRRLVWTFAAVLALSIAAALFFPATAFAAPTAACLNKLASGDNSVRKPLPLPALKRLAKGLATYKKHVSNPGHALLIDYSRNSKKRRAFMIDFKRCDVVAIENVIHGGVVYSPILQRDGDPDDDGMLDRCINRYGTRTNMTRPGLYLTNGCHQTDQAWPWITENCRAIRIIGLERTNNDAHHSGVVLHEHSSIPDDNSIKLVGQGCPAMPPGRLQHLLQFGLFSGTLVEVYAPQCG